MKKLAVTHIVLGILVIGSLAFWYLTVLSGYLTVEGTVPGSELKVIVSRNPGSGLLLGIWSCCYLGLGILVPVFGIAQYVSTRRHKGTGEIAGKSLAVIQTVLGGLVLASLIWFVGWVEFDYNNPVVIQEGLEITLNYVSGWYARLILWKAVAFALGLAVAGCGVFQLMKARQTENTRLC